MTYIHNSRRNFLKGLAATPFLSASVIPVFTTSNGINKEDSGSNAASDSSAITGNDKFSFYDGPQSSFFKELVISGNKEFPSVTGFVSQAMAGAIEHAPAGHGTAWGIPFHIPEKIILIKDQSFSIQVEPLSTNWLVFLHTSDFISNDSFKGVGQLNEHIADYTILYDDGSEELTAIRERHHIGMFRQIWGENNIQSVAAHKPMPQRAHHEQVTQEWGSSQTRVNAADRGQWINWLWAWENPHPEKQIIGFRFVPVKNVPVLISAISSGMISSNPFRWQTRQKTIFSLNGAGKFDTSLTDNGLLSQIQLDLGQVCLDSEIVRPYDSSFDHVEE